MYNKLLLPTLLTFTLVGCGASTDATDITENNSTQTATTEDTSSPAAELKSIPMLTILLSYNNMPIVYSEDSWEARIYGENDHQLNSYYKEVSDGNFYFTKATNRGVISVHLDKNHPDVSSEDPYFGMKVYPDLKDALESVDSQIDFSTFDTNRDGMLSNKELIVTFIIAGYEDAYEGYHVTNGIWAHQSCMSYDDEIAHADGVEIMSCQGDGAYALFGEQHDIEQPHQATIGIIAHEIGHATFNFPDLYNTQDPESGGVGYFDIMGAGTWATASSSEFPGETPTHFSAWSKTYAGWVTPQVLNNTDASLIESASTQYNIIKIPLTDTSYYLLENRNNSGYDRGLRAIRGIFDGGIAIWKIDETKLTPQRIQENNVNTDTQHKAVDLVEAVDGLIDSQGDLGNENALYYLGNKDYFLDYVQNISQRGAKMTLHINKY